MLSGLLPAWPQPVVWSPQEEDSRTWPRAEVQRQPGSCQRYCGTYARTAICPAGRCRRGSIRGSATLSPAPTALTLERARIEAGHPILVADQRSFHRLRICHHVHTEEGIQICLCWRRRRLSSSLEYLTRREVCFMLYIFISWHLQSHCYVKLVFTIMSSLLLLGWMIFFNRIVEASQIYQIICCLYYLAYIMWWMLLTSSSQARRPPPQPGRGSWRGSMQPCGRPLDSRIRPWATWTPSCE